MAACAGRWSGRWSKIATGGVWVGTVDGGVCRLDDQAFDAVTERDGLGSNIVLGVLESSGRGQSGSETAGAGLGRLADGRVTMYSAAEGVPHKVVMSLAETARRHAVGRNRRGRSGSDGPGRGADGGGCVGRSRLEHRRGRSWSTDTVDSGSERRSVASTSSTRPASIRWSCLNSCVRRTYSTLPRTRPGRCGSVTASRGAVSHRGGCCRRGSTGVWNFTGGCGPGHLRARTRLDSPRDGALRAGSSP